MRSWDLRTGEDVQELTLHRDYVVSMTAREHPGTGGGLLVTGGAADHLVIICDTEESGGVTCRHKLSGEYSHVDVDGETIFSAKRPNNK